MSDVFIAHVEEDAEIALRIALTLEETGYKTWCYEVDSIPGPSYIVRTGEAVAQSQAMVILISTHSLGSNQVTKEVIRAHESDKYFIPILCDITHVEFQKRQPEWREAIGSATSIRIPSEGVTAILPLIIDGLKAIGIQPGAKGDPARIDRIHRALNEIQGHPRELAKPIEEVKKVKPKRPLRAVIIAFAVVIVAIITMVFLLRQGGDSGKQAPGLSSTLTTTSPPATVTTTTPITKAPPSETSKPTTSTPVSSTTLPPASTPLLKPDLAIQDITWSPQSPSIGNDVTFTIIFSNLGKVKADASHVAYYIDDTFTDSIPVSSIDSGATAKVSFKWKAGSGTHKIKAIADFNNVIDESDETNNAKEIVFSGALTPDLIIQDIILTPTNPSQLSSGEMVFTATVKNQGNGAAGQFIVYYYVNGNQTASYNIDSLYAGQTTMAIYKQTLPWMGFSPGTYVLKVVVDATNSVAESDETNNTQTMTFSISK